MSSLLFWSQEAESPSWMIWIGADSKLWGSHCGWAQTSWFTSFPAGIFLRLPKHPPHVSDLYWRDLEAQTGTGAKHPLPHFTGQTSSETLLGGSYRFFCRCCQGCRQCWLTDAHDERHPNEQPLTCCFYPPLKTGSWAALTSAPVSGVLAAGVVLVSAEITQTWGPAKGNISLLNFLFVLSIQTNEILLCSWSEGWTQSPISALINK